MGRMSVIFVVLGLAALCGSASAGVVSFDGEGNQFGNPIFSGGYEFDSSASGWSIWNHATALAWPVVTNGTDIFNIGNGTLDVSEVNDEVFSFSQFDGADRAPGTGGQTIFVTGTLAGGGGTVAASFVTVADTFTTYSLPATFSNLASVTFSSSTTSFSIDNLSVNTVPEPTTLVLFGLGLVGVVAWRRKSRKAA